MDSQKTKSASVDECLSRFPPAQREIMEKVRHTIHEAVPGLTEAIKWSMPSFLNDKKFKPLQYLVQLPDKKVLENFIKKEIGE